jgi:hydroxymethylbilane synthase
MRIGTRRSALALAQAELVAELLGDCEIVPIVTAGDRGEDTGDKSRWVSALEDALLAGEIDLAVHSAKDVPGELAGGLELLGATARAAPEDVLCGAAGLDELPPRGRVGTSSIRRAAQLRAAREDLDVVAIRGNVDTRLRKLAEEPFDAIVLARAGLERLGREDAVGAVLDPARFVPAPGQGILALEGRAGDGDTRERVRAITDLATFACLHAERALASGLHASCNTPIGAHAVSEPNGLRLSAWIGLPDGSAWAADELVGDSSEPRALGAAVAERLAAAGGGALLRTAEEMAGVVSALR